MQAVEESLLTLDSTMIAQLDYSQEVLHTYLFEAR
jgi:hypothetical protein